MRWNAGSITGRAGEGEVRLRQDHSVPTRGSCDPTRWERYLDPARLADPDLEYQRAVGALFRWHRSVHRSLKNAILTVIA